MATFHDRLTAAVKAHGPLCVGLDPRLESLPIPLKGESVAKSYEAFCLKVLAVVRPFAGIVKPQAAFFEQAGPDGMKALQIVLKKARELGFVTILDAKRGDIASTATAYADAAFSENVWNADALTVNPYLGSDAVEPFILEARKKERGIFVLARTSNAGSGQFQNLICNGQPLYRHVAVAVSHWNDGKGDVGAVVGATHPGELKELRAAMPGVWFLVPGYGAQGGTAADVHPAFDANGLGAIVNSSRGVTFPFQPDDKDWEMKIEKAVRAAQRELTH